MPTSVEWLRPEALAEITAINPQTILDIGAGAGMWRRSYPYGTWTAVEIWEPYVERFALHNLYDTVILGDARHVDLGGTYDLVIAGDVLEHVPDPLALFNRLREVASYVLVQMPVIHWPQDAVQGNPYEVHVADVDLETLQSWPGVLRTYVAYGMGLAIATGLQPVREQP
jgi:trans-aconitate methyltransferase